MPSGVYKATCHATGVITYLVAGHHAAQLTCKRLLPACEDNGPHGWVFLEGLQCLVELHNQAIAERIEGLGAVQLDQPHVAVLSLLCCDDILKGCTWEEKGTRDFH